MLLYPDCFFWGGGGELHYMVKLSIPESALSEKNLREEMYQEKGVEMLNKINLLFQNVPPCGVYEMQN